MFTFLTSFLKSFFRSMSASAVSQKAGDTDQGTADHSPFLPLPASRHLEIEEYMRLLNLAAGSKLEAQDQLAQHVVIKLEHMKDAGKAQHEHIVATVRDHKRNLVRLSIERSKGHNDAPRVESKKFPKNYSSSLDSSSKMTLASIPNSSQDSILKPTAAVDVIQNIGDKTFPGSRVLRIFEPQPEPIPLLRLAAIVASVHEHNSSYTPLRSQCYWFAILVMGVAMTQGGRAKILIEKPSKSKAGIEFEEKFLNPVRLSDPNVNQSELNQIPIPHSDGKSPEMAGNLGMNIGKNKGISVVVVRTKEILKVALKAQQRYDFELDKVSLFELSLSTRRST
jgi:hypothetical protein